MKTITFYKSNGEIHSRVELNAASLLECHGMKIRCVLLDGSERAGYANPYYSFEEGNSKHFSYKPKDYIVLETFIYLNDETHKFTINGPDMYDVAREAVPLNIIDHIDAILCSGLRWGGAPTNRFNLQIQG